MQLRSFEVNMSFHYDLVDGVIIQRNTKGYGKEFIRDWNDYKRGFGDVNGNIYWMGLDDIHKLTTSFNHSLEIHLKKRGVTKIVRWSFFMVGSESEQYKELTSGFDASTSGLENELEYSVIGRDLNLIEGPIFDSINYDASTMILKR